MRTNRGKTSKSKKSQEQNQEQTNFYQFRKITDEMFWKDYKVDKNQFKERCDRGNIENSQENQNRNKLVSKSFL